MALEQFIEFTGITGEASAPDARGSIPVASWSFGVSRDATAATFRAFQFAKTSDSATPLLLGLCTQATEVAQAKLLVRQTGHRDPRLVVDLREVTVVEISTTFDRTTGELLDEVSLRFGRVWVGGAVVDRRGVGDQVNWFAWDLARARPASA